MCAALLIPNGLPFAPPSNRFPAVCVCTDETTTTRLGSSLPQAKDLWPIAPLALGCVRATETPGLNFRCSQVSVDVVCFLSSRPLFETCFWVTPAQHEI